MQTQFEGTAVKELDLREVPKGSLIRITWGDDSAAMLFRYNGWEETHELGFMGMADAHDRELGGNPWWPLTDKLVVGQELNIVAPSGEAKCLTPTKITLINEGRR